MLTSFNSTHDALRLHTKQAHYELDHTPCFQQLLSNQVGLKEYATCLSALSSWYSCHEKRLHKQRQIKRNLPFLQTKSDLISKDLDALSFNRDLPRSSDFRLVESGPCDLGRQLGFLYVIEGSTLGGLVIAPKIEKVLNRKDITHFYRCYRENKVKNFALTMDFIHQYCEENKCMNETQEGALQAFRQLQEWMLVSYSNRQVA
jgi:heme oxygenase